MSTKVGRYPTSKTLMLQVLAGTIPVENAVDYYRSIAASLRENKCMSHLGGAQAYLRDHAVVWQSGRLYYVNPYATFGSSIFIRAYEPRVYRAIKESSGKVFVDVGAYSGAYSVLTAGRFETVISLEPNPITYSILERNIELNRLTNVLASRIAASDRDETITFYEGLFSSTYTAVKDFILAKPEGTSIEVAGVRLDHLLAGYPEIDLVKIDVEGYEVSALEGMRDILPSIKKIIIEVDKENEPEVVEILKDYQLIVLEEGNISDNILFKRLMR